MRHALSSTLRVVSLSRLSWPHPHPLPGVTCGTPRTFWALGLTLRCRPMERLPSALPTPDSARPLSLPCCCVDGFCESRLMPTTSFKAAASRVSAESNIGRHGERLDRSAVRLAYREQEEKADYPNSIVIIQDATAWRRSRNAEHSWKIRDPLHLQFISELRRRQLHHQTSASKFLTPSPQVTICQGVSSISNSPPGPLAGGLEQKILTRRNTKQMPRTQVNANVTTIVHWLRHVRKLGLVVTPYPTRKVPQVLVCLDHISGLTSLWILVFFLVVDVAVVCLRDV